MRFVLLHYHILKNAGSTVENILDHNFGEQFAKFDTADPNGHISNQDLLLFLELNPQLKALSSHQIHYPGPLAPDIIFFDLCFLRDPIDRIRSMYDYFRKKPVTADPVSTLANELEPGEFVECLVDEYPHYVNNPQVVFLANGGVYDHPPGERDLNRAIDVMLEASFTGVVDCFDESLIGGQYFLGPVFPNLDCALPPVNVSSDGCTTLAARIHRFRNACNKRVYAHLLGLNALDDELVKRTRAEVMRRFKLVPNYSLRLASLRDRVRARLEAVPAAAAPDAVLVPVNGLRISRGAGG
jgi:hypothetical protein